MPTYEFRCPQGHEFEKFYRSISAAPREVSCPTCGRTAERLLSVGGGLVFKGSGFYITDYGKDGKKSQAAPPAAGGAGSGDAAATKGDGGAESKPTAEPKKSAEPKAPSPESSGAKSAAAKSSGKPKSGE